MAPRVTETIAGEGWGIMNPDGGLAVDRAGFPGGTAFLVFPSRARAEEYILWWKKGKNCKAVKLCVSYEEPE